MDDATLIEQVLAGNTHANRFLIEKYKNLVWHMVLRMVSQQEDVEDLCQEVFLRVFKDIGKFRGESKLSTWIGAIAYNMCITYLRKKGKNLVVPVEDYTPVTAGMPSEDSADKAFDKNNMKKIVHQIIESLPVQYRTVITLFYLEELSYKEIEEITGMPDGTIKSYLNRGRQAIREGIIKLVPDMQPELQVTK
ncbi:MAG: RNA polymerase sigma factor [Bacteroidales bacterium]|nr:RNA polymerase sigma factor [Bacteroidota bacterium]MBL6949489.1 RNA polymerase sigma factor [Bacteroidales bacterium]